MHLTPAGHLLHSATDLSNHLACAHLSVLNQAATLGRIGKPRPYEDPAAEVLRQRGHEHEQAFLDRLRVEGKSVIEVEERWDTPIPERWQRRAADTVEAMKSGADVIYQGCLFDGTWVGLPDFLLRVETPSDLGDWSYEVVDTKLARSAKGGAALQVSLYSDLLAEAQGAAPERMGIALGGPDARTEWFRVADFAAYYRSAKARFEALMVERSGSGEGAPDSEAGPDGEAGPTLPFAPDPVEFCSLCDWKQRCDAERRAVDHLALVAGIARGQRDALRAVGVHTMAGLAHLDDDASSLRPDIGPASLERIREQARIQVEGRERNEPVHELLRPVVAEQGLAALPEPSPGDLFFDIEADPYAFTHGLEYLFGYCDADGGFDAIWALDPVEEKAAFERFVDLVVERRGRSPALHVYHYGHYETTALKRLMGRHATREEEIDALLRGGVFVDLHRVVKQGLRASVESYSIKKLEPFYGFAREVDLRDANSALGHFEAWLQMGGGAAAGREGRRADVAGGGAEDADGGAEDADDLLARIEGYNRDDCISTLRLRNWLESLRPELEAQSGTAVPRPERKSGEPPESVREEAGEVADLIERLTPDVSAEASERTDEQHARWLLAQLLGFHRREAKSTWWEFYNRCAFGDEELVEDRATMGLLDYIGPIDTVKRSTIHRYRFPPQEHDIGIGDDAHDPATEKTPGTVVAVDEIARTIDIRRGTNSDKPHPRGLVPLDYFDDTVMRESLRRVANGVVEHGIEGPHAYRAATDLLQRRPPRVDGASGGDLREADESPLAAARRLATSLDRTVLPIQGPPGAGKTFTAARMIVTLLRAGKRVGVTATSHKVITHLVGKVCEAAREEGVTFSGVQRASERSGCGADAIEIVKKNADVLERLESGEALLAAGTSWLWARPEMEASVDVLFVDEAGQFSLANAVAVSPAASSLVLVGDPRQLEQPMKGAHPPGAGVSAMDHLLQGDATVAPDRGLFLADTWRLHPDICAFTSEVFYRSRLAWREDLDRQSVEASGVANGSGLRFVGVGHAGRSSEAPEEVEVVARLVETLVGETWVDRDQARHRVTLADVLIVAPYNLQVAALENALPDGARVGTVDKFQGQEAPVVIYSMTSSSAEDAPRGMAFLYSPNRLNVATSRARCLAVVVGSPALFAPECRTPHQMRLANAFCRFLELAARRTDVGPP